MTEMVERVAAMICRTCTSPVPLPAEYWDHQLEYVREHYRKSARAVIEAMREPTEDMAIAGAVGIGGHMPSPLDAADAWRAMIDAALQKR
jgi:hypothetical protein